MKFNKPIALNCGKPTELPLKVRFTGDYSFAYDDAAKTLLFKREPKKAAKTEFNARSRKYNVKSTKAVK